MQKGNKSDYLVAIKSSLGNYWTQEDKLPLSEEPVVLVVDAMDFIQHIQQAGNSNFYCCEFGSLLHTTARSYRSVISVSMCF